MNSFNRVSESFERQPLEGLFRGWVEGEEKRERGEGGREGVGGRERMEREERGERIEREERGERERERNQSL